MHTVNFLTRIVEHHEVLAYGIVFLGLIFEGEVVVISTGILAHLGALNFWFALGFILLGGFAKTFIFYALGRILNNKFERNKIFAYVERKVKSVLPHFNEKPFWSIFASKFIMGVNYMVVIFCGYESVDYRKFLKAEISSTLIWAPALLTVGYFFGQTALRVSREMWKFTLVIIALIAVFILFDKLVSWLYGIFEEFFYKVKKDL
jgi:membrane-associated protein